MSWRVVILYRPFISSTISGVEANILSFYSYFSVKRKYLFDLSVYLNRLYK